MRNARFQIALATLLSFSGFVTADSKASAATFFDSLSTTDGGTESVTGTRWLAGLFTTNASAYTSLTATLSLSQTTAGVIQLDLYSDGGLKPGTLLNTFTAPTSFSTTLADAAFTLTGASLTASTNYWIVLHAPSGSYNWGWTSDFTVMQGWADSSNGGGTWFGSDAYPLQYKVASGVTVPTYAADFNSSGIVDAADLSVWKTNFGLTGTATKATGDANLDLNVDGVDFLLWQRQFGSGTAASTAYAVPEPEFGMQALMTGGALFAAARRILKKSRVFKHPSTVFEGNSVVLIGDEAASHN